MDRLTVGDVVPCQPFTLKTLVDFGVLKERDNGVYGTQPVVYKDDRYLLAWLDQMERVNRLGSTSPVNRNSLPRLIEAGVKVPSDKAAIFGEDFSRIRDYNDALDEVILTGQDAPSEFRDTLSRWGGKLLQGIWLDKSVLDISVLD